MDMDLDTMEDMDMAMVLDTGAIMEDIILASVLLMLSLRPMLMLDTYMEDMAVVFMDTLDWDTMEGMDMAVVLDTMEGMDMAVVLDTMEDMDMEAMDMDVATTGKNNHSAIRTYIQKLPSLV